MTDGEPVVVLYIGTGRKPCCASSSPASTDNRPGRSTTIPVRTSWFRHDWIRAWRSMGSGVRPAIEYIGLEANSAGLAHADHGEDAGAQTSNRSCGLMVPLLRAR